MSMRWEDLTDEEKRDEEYMSRWGCWPPDLDVEDGQSKPPACERCGEELRADDKCPACDLPRPTLQILWYVCAGCSYQYRDPLKGCPNCGLPLQGSKETPDGE